MMSRVLIKMQKVFRRNNSESQNKSIEKVVINIYYVLFFKKTNLNLTFHGAFRQEISHINEFR